MFEEEGENHVFPVAAVGDQSKVRERPLRRTHLEEERGWEGREGREEGHEEGEWEEGERCSHQNLQAKGHKYLMTTPLILNVVIYHSKRLLHVYHQSILVEFNVH